MLIITFELYLVVIAVMLALQKHPVFCFLLSLLYIFLFRASVKTLLGLVAGIVVSPIVMNFSYLLVFHQLLKPIKKMKIDLDLVSKVLWEEIIWRDFPLFIMISLEVQTIIRLIVVIILSVLFIVTVHKEKDKTKMTEMILYTVLLYALGFVFFGMHYSLHLARNIYINSVGDDIQNDVCSYD